MSRSRATCLAVSYHYVRDTNGSRFARLNVLPTADFASQVRLLAETRDVLTPDAFLGILDAGGAFDAPAALLTFDDGLIDHYVTVFPLLRAAGLRAIFFVSSCSNAPAPQILNVQKVQLLLATLGAERLLLEVERLIEDAGIARPAEPAHPVLYRYDAARDREVKRLLNYELPYEVADHLLATLFRRHVGDEQEVAQELYLTEAMIREMAAAGMTFGFHTRQHRVLSRLTPAAQRDQIEHGIAWIRELTGQATVPFCYPHGHAHAYTPETVAILRRAGYSMAFTAVRDFTPASAALRYELPRYDTCDVGAAVAQEQRAAVPV